MTLHRPALHLAAILQQAAFPFVSVLDGGYPELISYLVSSGDALEPLVINYDHSRYQAFMKIYGIPLKDKGKIIEKNETTKNNKKVNNEQSVLNIALSVASRLKHRNMESILRDKVSQKS